MDYITKCDCYIHSLKDGEGNHQLAEATIIKKTGDNSYIAEYNGARCTAIFNPFVGRYYVDDIYGGLPDEKPAGDAGAVGEGGDDRNGKSTYEVTITEILKLKVDIEARNRQEAEDKVFDDWRASKHILTADDFDEVKFKAVRKTGRKVRNQYKAVAANG